MSLSIAPSGTTPSSDMSATRHLKTEQFHVVQLDTTDEPDNRGIDVGILTQLPIVEEPKAFAVDFKRDSGTCGKTRDIVRVGLRLPDGQTLFVFGVHFPSGRSPFRCRIRAFKELNKLAKDLPAGSLAVAAGDYNINCVEGRTDAFARLLRKGNWSASPLVSAGWVRSSNTLLFSVSGITRTSGICGMALSTSA